MLFGLCTKKHTQINKTNWPKGEPWPKQRDSKGPTSKSLKNNKNNSNLPFAAGCLLGGQFGSTYSSSSEGSREVDPTYPGCIEPLIVFVESAPFSVKNTLLVSEMEDQKTVDCFFSSFFMEGFWKSIFLSKPFVLSLLVWTYQVVFCWFPRLNVRNDIILQ